jgi:long-chain-fatty-acid--CoA ligase ACSBG
MKVLEAGIILANKHTVSNHQKVQKLKLLPKDFSILGGALGSTMKVKRNVVHNKHLGLIESLFE